MSSFVPRHTAPITASNKYYRHPGYYDTGGVNGVNSCFLINNSTGAVMPNCVGYAWGRAYELLQSQPALCQGDAYLWWTYNDGYERSPLGANGYATLTGPKNGAIACMDYANPGHVAVVEDQISATEWTISESIYGGVFFRLGTIRWSSSAQKWFCWYSNGSGGETNPWDVKGFIYPPYNFTSGALKLISTKRNKRRRILYV